MKLFLTKQKRGKRIPAKEAPSQRIEEKIPPYADNTSSPNQQDDPTYTSQVANQLETLKKQSTQTKHVLQYELTKNFSKQDLIDLVLKQKAETDRLTQLLNEYQMLHKISVKKRKEAEQKQITLSKKNAELEQSVHQLQSTESKNKQALNETTEKLQANEERMKHLSEQNTKLHQQVNAFKEHSSTKKTEMQAKDQLIAKKNAKLQELQKKTQSNDAYIKELESQVDTLKKKNQSMRESIQQEEQKNYENKINKLIEENNNELLTLQSTIDTQKTRIQELQQKLNQRIDAEHEIFSLFQQKLK